MYCEKCGANMDEAEKFCGACGSKVRENISSTQQAMEPQSLEKSAKVATSVRLAIAFGTIGTIKGVLARGVPSGLTGIGYMLFAVVIFSLLALLPIKYYFKRMHPLYISVPIAVQKQVKFIGIAVGVIIALTFNTIWFHLIYPEIIGMVSGCLTSYIVIKNKK